jgi:hypothetical protein
MAPLIAGWISQGYRYLLDTCAVEHAKRLVARRLESSNRTALSNAEDIARASINLDENITAAPIYAADTKGPARPLHVVDIAKTFTPRDTNGFALADFVSVPAFRALGTAAFLQYLNASASDDLVLTNATDQDVLGEDRSDGNCDPQGQQGKCQNFLLHRILLRPHFRS